MQTHEMIQALAEDLRPVSPKRFAREVVFALVFGATAALCISVFVLGSQTDFDRAAHGWSLWLKWIYTIPICASAFLAAQAHSCRAAGVAQERIVIDPGFGFGKSQAHNLELLRHLEELAEGEYPMLVGLSRKSMLASISGRPDGDRLAGSVALAVIAALKNARIIRAHDVAATVDALKIVAAVGLVPTA